MSPSPLSVVNRVLAPANLKIDSVRTRAWDRFFERWISEAKSKGIDPNDVGDIEWENDALSRGLDEFYLPRISETAVVLELGPGSGRLSRHLVGKVKNLVLVDYSPAVTKWLTTYLNGKGDHEVRLIETPGLPGMPPRSVDVAFAHGVVEHFDQEVLVAFLVDLERVLKPGAQFVFTFNDLSSPEARKYLTDAGGVATPNRFRFYEPAALERLGHMFGFRVDLTITGGRISFAVFTRPSA